MNWIPDSNWLKVLDVKGSIAGAVALASLLILGLAEADRFYLGEVPGWGRATIAIVAILSSSLVLRHLWDWIVARAKKASDKRKIEEGRNNNERKTLQYLDALSDRERKIFSYLVQKNQQSFQADVTGGYAAPLIQKGLIEMGSGLYEQSDWPFTIPSFVWKELHLRKDEFSAVSSDIAHPWRRPIL